MFNSYSGLFHFLFANQDDYYYTKSYIKMNFKSYLISNLRKSGYSNIYYFEEKSNGMLSLNSYNCDFVDLEASNVSTKKQTVEPIKKEKKFGFFRGFSSGRKNNSEIDENSNDITSSVENNRVSQKQMGYDKSPLYFMQLLQNFGKMKSIVIVIPMEIFSNIYDGKIQCDDSLRKNIFDTLRNINTASNGNIILLTSSVNARENNNYFLNKYLVRNNKEEKPNMVFFDRRLFPEIYKAYDGDLEKISKLTLVYDVLKKCLGQRMVIWNTLSFDNILNAVTYSLLRYTNQNPNELFYPAGIYAYVIWQWYKNYEFHNKYEQLLKNLPQNVFGYNKVIEQIISGSFLPYKNLTEIVDRENIKNGVYDVALLKNNCHKVNEFEGCITTNTPDMEIGIIKYLNIFNKIVLENIENETCKGISEYLPNFISFFSEQSFHHFQNRGSLAFELLCSDKYSKILNRALDFIKTQKDWNIYAEGIATLLEFIFDFCYTQANENIEFDPHNSSGTIIFKKYMECLDFYLEEYRKPFHKEDEIEMFLGTFLNCMESKDIDRIKNFNLQFIY